VVRWSLLEFSPVGEGFINREEYYLKRSLFDKVVDQVMQIFVGPASLDIYRTEAKTGTYALITPSGHLYGTTESTVNSFFPTIGSIIQDHLATLAERLPFSRQNHIQRYKNLIG
jgi:hypothetical protein